MEGSGQYFHGKLKDLEEGGQISPQELFPPSFMVQYSEFNSVEEFTHACGLEPDDLLVMSDEVMNNLVSRMTSFSTWLEMQDAAIRYWFERHLSH